MSTHDTDLSSLSPATLRAALDASEKRVRREKEKIQRDIRKLQNRLDELEEGEAKVTPEPEKNAAGGSRHKTKRPRVDSSSDDEAIDERYNRWPIAKARKRDQVLVPPLRYVHSRGETFVMTGCTAHHAQGIERRGCVASGTRALLILETGVVSLVNAPIWGVI